MGGSRSSIPAATKARLWGQAAGCCEICSKPLYEDEACGIEGNYSNIAHIHAYSAGGPRFDPTRNEAGKNAFENLMLLCPQCHKTIDSDPEGYPAEALAKLKSRREERISKAVAASSPERACVVTLGAPIHGNGTKISRSEWSMAMAAAGMTYEGFGEASLLDPADPAATIEENADRMRRSLRRVECTLDPSTPLAVFAIAPQPLLLLLGNLLGDKRKVTIFQKQRETDSWCWQESEPRASFDHDKPAPSEDDAEVAVVLSVSGKVNISTLPDDIRQKGMQILELRALSPSVNIARTPDDVRRFASEATALLDEIHAAMPKVARIHLFPALPVSMAVRFGALFNQNLLSKALVYEKSEGHFVPSIEIGANHEL